MKNMTAVLITAPLFILTSLQVPGVLAAESDAVTLNKAGGLELSITANRRLQEVDETLAPVSVITRKNIEQIQAQDVIDILRLQTGVNISRSGGAGSQTSVFLRGAESRHALVLLDGVRVASATIGSFDWSSLAIDQIDRIEIVRGARTSLYGSDAIGGIIQVFTRKNAGPYASITYGSDNTKRGSAGISKSIGKTRVSLNVSAEDSDGFSSSNVKAGEFTFDPDDDGYQKKSVSAALSHQFTDKTKAGLDVFYSKNKADYDQGTSETDLETIKLYVQSKVSNKWSQQLSLSQSINDSVSASSFGVSKFESKRRELNWQNDLKLSKNSDLTLGANYLEDNGKTADFDDKITNKAIYASLIQKYDKLNLELSGRYDKHSQAGSDVTGQVAAGYAFTPSTTAYVSYGSAFRAPNINDLYYPGFFGSFAGNPDLEAETSKTFEIGLKSRLSKMHRLEASLFDTRVDNLINLTGVDNQAINVGKVTLKGLELSYSGNTDEFDWGFGATIQRLEDAAAGERLIRRPNNKFTANVGLNLSRKTRIGIDAEVSSSRLDNNFAEFPSERVKLGAYNLLNLSLNHKLSKHTNLGLRVENLTNEDYELAYGFNTPERSAYLTFTYK